MILKPESDAIATTCKQTLGNPFRQMCHDLLFLFKSTAANVESAQVVAGLIQHNVV